MRIGFISTYPPIECGIGTYTAYLNKALSNLHNETFVISQIGAQGPNVFPVFTPDSHSLAADVFDMSDKITPDIVHIQHEFGLYGDQKGVQIAELILRYRIAGEPVAVTFHTVKPDIPPDEQIIFRVTLAESSAVIVHEVFQKEILVKYFGNEEKIHVVPHGVREVPPIDDAKEKLEIAGKKVILLCGYFRPTKGFHKIVELFPDIVKKCPNAVLVIAGKSRGLEHREFQHHFFETINNSPVRDKILVLRGQFPQRTFDTILNAADVVALPYEAGGQSGILAHCFAFEKPVVTSDLPAFRHILQKSGGGLICYNKNQYIKNISKILEGGSLEQELKENIKNYVKNEVNWNKVARQHIDIYHKIVRVPYGDAKHVYWDD